MKVPRPPPACLPEHPGRGVNPFHPVHFHFTPQISPKQRAKGRTRSWPMGVHTLDPLPPFCTRESLPAPCGLRREAPDICTPAPCNASEWFRVWILSPVLPVSPRTRCFKDAPHASAALIQHSASHSTLQSCYFSVLMRYLHT